MTPDTTSPDAASSDEDLAAQAQPLAGPDPLEVPLDQIPLPPKELAAELDNSKREPDEDEAKPEVATLEFVGDEMPVRVFPLRYPFRWQGRVVEVVEVRCLTTAEMGEAARKSVAGAFDIFDAYAAMTGLPAPVLRALPSVDGEPITEACYDFLPRFLRPAADG